MTGGGFLEQHFPGALLDTMGRHYDRRLMAPAKGRERQRLRLVHVHDVIGGSRPGGAPRMLPGEPWKRETSERGRCRRGTVVGAEVIHVVALRHEPIVNGAHQSAHAGDPCTRRVVGDQNPHDQLAVPPAEAARAS